MRERRNGRRFGGSEGVYRRGGDRVGSKRKAIEKRAKERGDR